MVRLDSNRVFRTHLALALGALTLVGCTAYAATASPASPPPASVQGQGAAVDWQAVEQAMGKAGTLQAGDVYRISLPRTDLQVTARGVPIQAALALGSWVAFKPVGSEARGTRSSGRKSA